MPRTAPLLNSIGGEMRTRALEAGVKAALETERKDLLTRLHARAEAEDWSQRELIRRTGLSKGSFLRLKSGTADLSVWLPKLRTAAARLSP